MAHTAETVEIDSTKVKVATGIYGDGSSGRTCTVNVYDHTNTEGCYREVYRLPDASSVTAGDVSRNAKDLEQLDRYLIGRGAVKEGARTR